jgi:hypothetical protein
MHSRRSLSCGYRIVLVLVLFIAASCALACSDQPKSGNANSSSAAASNKNASAAPEAREPDSGIDIKDPDRFSLSMTISAQEINAEPGKMPTLQFSFTRFDSDRRWAFSLPAPLGQVVYLEKSGLLYLILSDRKQYIEVTAGDLGFQLGSAMSPSAIANQLKARARIDVLGVEPVNGRTARKYRFKSDIKDGAIYVDIETGLPVRAEVNTSPASGKALRIIIEGRDIQLNPDRSIFDVPAGMKKVSTQEAKQAIDMFAGILKSFANVLTGSAATLPQELKPVANKNAVRPRR